MSAKRKRPTGNEDSTRQRLLNVAKARNEDFNFVLTRYAIERFLYRLGLSPHRDRFILKGAMLFQVWTGHTHRPTRDLDLLGKGTFDARVAENIVREICRHPVPDDAIRFDDNMIAVQQVRDDREYHGLRVKLQASLGSARIRLQIDIGLGDAVTPAPHEVDYPTLLDHPAPRLAIYPRETVVAEKFQAIVMLGAANSRIKDFYDIWVLARTFTFDGLTLSRAISATFHRRQTAIPPAPPVAFLPEFWQDGAKWRAFLSLYRIESEHTSINEVLVSLTRFLLPPATCLLTGNRFASTWSPGGDWIP